MAATAEPITAANEDVVVSTPVKEVTTKSKSKKPVTKKPRSSPSHPPYFEMINEALTTLKERNGSSQYAIQKFIEENHKNLPSNFRKLLLVALRQFVPSGRLVKVKGSFKLPSASSKPAAAKPKKAVVAAKPKKAVSAAAKPKAAPAKVAGAKRKAVADVKPKAKAVKKAAPVAKRASTRGKK